MRTFRPIRRSVAAPVVLPLLLTLPPAAAGVAAAQQAEPSAPALEALVERATAAVVLIDITTAADSRQGSGFLVDPRGLILTNQHVIRDARTARVKLASGDVYDRVKVLVEDVRRDIAVLEIAGFDLPTLPLGNSDSLRIGAPVVLIGSPLGLENTVSTGILSGRRQESEGYQLLQLTAPASQGSSGGAVLNAQGTVVGIAVSQLVAGQNLNFAVPVNYARGLLQHLDREPIAVLEPGARAGAAEPAPMSASRESVNRGLTFDLESLGGYVVESREELGSDRFRRARVTYRLIETVGGGPPRMERYLESETVRVTEPFGTHETIRRERVRTMVATQDLRPVSSSGEVSWSTGRGWQDASYQLRFEGTHALGVVTDTTGRAMEIDRTLPQGVLLREMRDFAFATLAVDSLVGRSVELTTFDPWTAELTADRYDVIAPDTIRVAGQTRHVLRVNVASGLTNETVYFERNRPRIAVRRVRQDGSGVVEVSRVEIVPRGQ